VAPPAGGPAAAQRCIVPRRAIGRPRQTSHHSHAVQSISIDTSAPGHRTTTTIYAMAVLYGIDVTGYALSLPISDSISHVLPPLAA
jgi:hypothetical protein